MVQNWDRQPATALQEAIKLATDYYMHFIRGEPMEINAGEHKNEPMVRGDTKALGL